MGAIVICTLYMLQLMIGPTNEPDLVANIQSRPFDQIPDDHSILGVAFRHVGNPDIFRSGKKESRTS